MVNGMDKKEKMELISSHIELRYQCDMCEEIFDTKKQCSEHIVKAHLCQKCKYFQYKLYDGGEEMGVTVYCNLPADGKLECIPECFVPKEEGKDG